MKQSSINISNDDYKKIQAQAEKKLIALAEYIRHLIQLGLKVEEAAEHHSSGHSNDSASKDEQGKLLSVGIEIICMSFGISFKMGLNAALTAQCLFKRSEAESHLRGKSIINPRRLSSESALKVSSSLRSRCRMGAAAGGEEPGQIRERGADRVDPSRLNGE